MMTWLTSTHRRTVLHRGASLLAVAATVAIGSALSANSAEEVAKKLNDEPAQRVTAANTSYRKIFDAYLDMTAPPRPVGPGFTVTEIHPGMDDWEAIAEWSAANSGMGDTLIEVRDALGFGLPYGETDVDEAYRSADLVARIGVDGDLRRIEFPYVAAIEQIAVYGMAEMYRLAEAGEFERAFDVGMALNRMLRTLCDRVMLAEKTVFFGLLADVLSAQRDIIYLYRDTIDLELLKNVARNEIPFLRPDRKRLEMPEGERIVGEALLAEVFDDRGQPDVDAFSEVFGSLQSAEKPLTRFGAAKRWKRIAEVHGSSESTQQKLVDIYDDWWRRWRMRQYDPMMDLPTEFSRTNPIRYGAVIYSIQDIETLFELRKRLVAEVNGAAMTAGMVGYRLDFDTWPDDREKAYAVFMRKLSDFDPWDPGYGRFLYRWLGSERKAVDTPNGRIWVDGGVIYARGVDLSDDDFEEHTPDGSFGDMIVFPPVRALEREQGVGP